MTLMKSRIILALAILKLDQYNEASPSKWPSRYSTIAMQIERQNHFMLSSGSSGSANKYRRIEQRQKTSCQNIRTQKVGIPNVLIDYCFRLGKPAKGKMDPLLLKLIMLDL